VAVAACPRPRTVCSHRLETQIHEELSGDAGQYRACA
jgi:hypothetical protein